MQSPVTQIRPIYQLIIEKMDFLDDPLQDPGEGAHEVASVEAYRAAFGLPLGRHDVARLAFEIERVDLGLAGGRQDHYAASFGGINVMEFLPGDRVIVNPLRISPSYLHEFEASLTVCFTGQSRASAIIQDQVKALTQTDKGTLLAMHQLKADAIDMKQALLVGNIREVAEVLNRSWLAKRQTSGLISNSTVERVFELGLSSTLRILRRVA
jgi:D-glycero-alpha-D-manno-heptose-7-phosphate kinase